MTAVQSPSALEQPPRGGRLRALLRYPGVAVALAQDLLRQFPRDTMRLLCLSGASLACQFLALAALLGYVRALEGDTMLSGLFGLFGTTARSSVALAALVAAATMLLFFAFVLFEFRANAAILALCRRYQATGVSRAMALASRLPHWFDDRRGDALSPKSLRRLLSVDVHHRSRLARLLLLAVMPGVRLLLAIAVLLYLAPLLALLVFVIVGFPVAGLYWVGRHVADTISAREDGVAAPIAAQQARLAASWRSGIPIEEAALDEAALIGQPGSRYPLFFDRLLARARGQMLINSATTLGLIVLVLSIGYWVLVEAEGSWNVWLTCLVALRFFLASLQRVAQSVLQSTRYLRQVWRFNAFLRYATAAVGASPQPPCPAPLRDAFRQRDGDIGLDEEDDDDF